MAFNQDDLATIEKAIASGVVRVKLSDGSEQWFQNITEMKKIRDFIKAELKAGGKRFQRRTIKVSNDPDIRGTSGDSRFTFYDEREEKK